jgi:general stress protein CsbA
MLFSIFAAFGVFGGISALFVGIVFVVLHGVIAGDRIFDTLGTALLIAAIPMILIGSIFIDKIEEKES